MNKRKNTAGTLVNKCGKLDKKKNRSSLLILAKYAVDLGPRDLARNFDKYFEESLK